MHFRADVDLYKMKPESGGSSFSLCTPAIRDNTILEPSPVLEGAFSFRAATLHTEKSFWEIQFTVPKSFVLSASDTLV